MLNWLYDIINYPLITVDYPIIQNELTVGNEQFIFSPLNIIFFIIIYLLGKLLIKYIKRYFNVLHLTDKQLKIEGKEIAVWKLSKQIIHILVLFLSIVSLRINNDQIDSGQILEYEFFRLGDFHFAVYHIFYVIIVVFVAKLVFSALSVVLIRTIRRKNGNKDEGTEYVYVQLAKYIIYIIAFIVVVRSFGVNLDAVMWLITGLAVGAGIGLQNIFRDYFSGLLLLFEGNIKVGDIIEIDYLSGKQDLIAKVTSINLRSTKIETVDGKVLIVPNSKLTHENVNNWNLDKKLTRYKIPITISYKTDTELAKSILLKCAHESKMVNARKPALVRLLNFGHDGLEMDLVFWASQNLEIEQHKSDIRFAIVEEFRKNKITIPFPQRDLHVKNEGSENLTSSNSEA